MLVRTDAAIKDMIVAVVVSEFVVVTAAEKARLLLRAARKEAWT